MRARPLVHFLLATGIAFVALGSDPDRLRPRSALSRAAGGVYDLLRWPHDAALRALPDARLVGHAWTVPPAVAAHSLAWGMPLYALLRGPAPARRREEA